VDQTKFLERIGSAQTDEEVRLKVLNVTKEQSKRMEEEKGEYSAI
jgi:hypothetical protein